MEVLQQGSSNNPWHTDYFIDTLDMSVHIHMCITALGKIVQP